MPKHYCILQCAELETTSGLNDPLPSLHNANFSQAFANLSRPVT